MLKSNQLQKQLSRPYKKKNLNTLRVSVDEIIWRCHMSTAVMPTVL